MQSFVPVGHDQLQHLEFHAHSVRKFNSRFGKHFIAANRSHRNSTRDEFIESRKENVQVATEDAFLGRFTRRDQSKIKRAVTDFGSRNQADTEKKPGMSNLLKIYSIALRRKI